MKKNIAIILSGCGREDGTEITEAVSTLIALSELGARYKCFAPDLVFENRKILQESARISRGHIQNIKELKADSFDGLILPGGYGAVLHLKDHPEVARVIKEFHKQSKPIGAICIAPSIITKVLGPDVEVTLGKDPKFIECAVDDYVTDRSHKVITTPAYMYDDAKPFEVFTGIRGLVCELIEMA